MKPSDAELTQRETALLRQIHELSHAVQSGVAVTMELEPKGDTTPKHLRTGINCAMVNHAALVALLIDEGLINREDYFESLVKYTEREVKLYEESLSQKLKKVIKLQ